MFDIGQWKLAIILHFICPLQKGTIGIFSVDRNGIGGGETHLYKQKDDSHPAFSKVLNPGEFLVFKDDQYFHYTSPVNAIAVEQGTRDVFVLTCPGLFPPEAS